MKKNSTIWIFALIVFAVPVSAFALLNLYEKKFDKLPVLDNAKDKYIGDFRLINQEGEIKSTAAWKNKIVIVDFFFTHCPTTCPKMTKSLKKIQAAYSSDNNIIFNSFSIDTERDSSSQLKKYAAQYQIESSNWDLLTGDKKEIYKLARNSFDIVATDGDGGPEDFIHSEKLVLIDTQKRIRGYYDGTNPGEVNQLIIDIKKLKYEK